MEEKAKVYFTDFRSLSGTNLQKKLAKFWWSFKKYWNGMWQ